MSIAHNALNLLPSGEINPTYKVITLHNFRQLPQLRALSEEQKFSIEVVGNVFPFKVNNYVIDNLIDWDRAPDDPIFHLTFPQPQMLIPEHFRRMATILKSGASKREIREEANKIRMELNPHPDGQIQYNTPSLEGQRLDGMQHKYKETILFFPSQGQTCHAYCSFCFRWPQFVGLNDYKFATRETHKLIAYLREHPEISDVLLTGGDPLIMKTKILSQYVHALLHTHLPNLQTFRIGTKALSYWPQRFLTDPDAEQLLALFREVTQTGKHLSIMAHFNHPRELKTKAAQDAIALIRKTGAQIRTQSPVLAHINDKPEVWEEAWKIQVGLGCVPYYMFVVRDTGAQEYFGVPIARAWEIFQRAYQKTSGLARTVRGPSMSATPGKVHIVGISEINGEKVFTLQFLQARNPDWVLRPFFAKYDEEAIWLDDLVPAFGEDRFFFERESSDSAKDRMTFLPAGSDGFKGLPGIATNSS